MLRPQPVPSFVSHHKGALQSLLVKYRRFTGRRCAPNAEKAIEMAKEAISVYIESLEEDGEPIPDDNKSLEYSLTLAS